MLRILKMPRPRKPSPHQDVGASSLPPKRPPPSESSPLSPDDMLSVTDLIFLEFSINEVLSLRVF